MLCTHLKHSYLQALNRIHESGSVAFQQGLHVFIAIDSLIFTSGLIKCLSRRSQGAQRWISYGRASAARKTSTSQSQVGRTSGRQTRRRSAAANVALQSRWLSHTHTHTWIQNLTNAFHRHTISLRMQCWPLSHTHTSEKPALQGRCLWLIISIQRLWGQLLSRLQDYELEPSKICGMCVHNWFLAEKHLNHQVYKE